MYDPSMRVLTVLELLQARERVTGKQLADHLEVSDRTVQRYIMRLQDLGVPVESTRGPGGYYRLKPGFRIPPLMFDADEALAISIGLDALASIGLSTIAPAAEGAKSKLERVLPLAFARAGERGADGDGAGTPAPDGRCRFVDSFDSGDGDLSASLRAHCL